MWKFVGKINPWLYTGLLLGLGPFAWHVSREYGWPAAWSPLLVILLLAILSALRGPQSAVGFTTAVAAVCSAGAAAVTPPIISGPWTAVLAFGTFLTVCATGYFINARRAEVEKESSDPQEKLTDRLRALYDLQRQLAERTNADESNLRNLPGDAEAADSSPIASGSPNGVSRDGERINYPLLLLSLQDMARSIASNLDMDTLVATVHRTSTNLLKCAECQIYVWNAAANTLTPASSSQSGSAEARRGLPSDRGMTKWVLQNRQIITREDLQTDYSLQALLDDDPSPPRRANPAHGRRRTAGTDRAQWPAGQIAAHREAPADLCQRLCAWNQERTALPPH
jgi:hypothetical protein